MVIGKRSPQHGASGRTLADRKKSPPVATKARRKRKAHWQRRQELLRRDQAMVAVSGLICLVGTLAMLYIMAQANATDEGYRRSELRRKIKKLDGLNLTLQSEIRLLQEGSRIAEEAKKRNLVRSADGIRYFGEKPLPLAPVSSDDAHDASRGKP